jgi:hypothetical protein
MKRHLFLFLVGSISLVIIAEGKPQKAELAAVFKNAQFAYVEAYRGDEFNPNLVPDDRQAISQVEQGLKDWKRYTVVYQRDRADLVFLVRKGRIASVTARAVVDIRSQPHDRNPSQPDPTRSDPSPGAGVGVDAEAGPPDDILSIYIVNPSGGLDGPVWSHSLKGGLDAPSLPLFARIKHEVETAYPK